MTTDRTPVERWVAAYEKDPEFVAEGLSTEAIEEVLSHLKGERNQQWLAEAMRVSKQQVSRWLNAPSNLTLLSVARMSVALGVKPRLILDSEAHFIRRLSDVPTQEEFFTEKARRGLPTDDTLASVRPAFTANDEGYPIIGAGAKASVTA